jgi:hypothetical protein
MLDALQEYLKTSTPLEYQIQVEEAHTHFERFGLQDHEVAFMDLLMTVDNEDRANFQDELTGLVTELQRHVLKQLEIELVEDLSIAQINQVLNFVSDIEDTELVDDVCNIIDSQTDTSDKLCQLMGLLNSQEPEHYYDLILSVSETLLIKIKETVQKNTDEDDVVPIDIETNRKLLTQLNVFMSAMDRKPPIVYNLMIDGINPGLKFEEYYTKISPYLTSTDPQKSAYEIISATKVCKDIEGNVRDTVTEHLNKTFNSIDIVTPVLVAYDQMLLDFNHRVTSGIKRVTP